MRALLTQVGKRYVAGPGVEDAVKLAQKYSALQRRCTLGYWDRVGEAPEDVLLEYQHSIAELPASGYVSIKMPALDFSEALLDEVAKAAQQRDVRLHFDAMGPQTAARTRLAVERLAARHGRQLKIGYTLPGRWVRSVDDAAWANEMGIAVRIVKGQFQDERNLDPAEGYLAVAKALAGRAQHVGVATHNPALCQRALHCLLDAGTSTSLEQLHGLPMRRQMQLADGFQLNTTVYIAYGQAYLPYAVSSVLSNPRSLYWLLINSLPF